VTTTEREEIERLREEVRVLREALNGFADSYNQTLEAVRELQAAVVFPRRPPIRFRGF